jgi:exopolysaccharide biosynthesis polyprenyl glycosylphosphotransferase
MFKSENLILKRIHQVIDLLILSFGFITAYFTKKYFIPGDFGGLSITPNYYIVLLLLIISSYISFNIIGFYKPFKGYVFDVIIGKTLKGLTLSYALMVFFLFLIKETEVSRLMLAIAYSYTFVALLLSKSFIFYGLNFHDRKDSFQKKILIIGSKQQAVETILSIQQNTTYASKIIGCLDMDLERVGRSVVSDVDVIGTLDEYYNILNSQTVDEVIFAVPVKLVKNADDYIGYAEKTGVNIRFLPNWYIKQAIYKPQTASIYFDQSIGTPTIVLSSKPQKEIELMIKSVMDYLISLIVLILLSPLMILIAVGIKLTSKGPVFFTQERNGLGGRKIKMIKFRTMVVNAEKLQGKIVQNNEVDGPVFKIANDPRITKIGTLLRKTSLDELPQLFNILKGEMSLVGPRPPIPAEVEQYETWQRRRLAMKPGLTCIWQVSGRNDIDFNSWMKMDLEYIDHWSIWLDIKLLLLTIPAVLFGTGH